MRWSRLFNIPVASQPPDNFPNNTVMVQRALTALKLSCNADKIGDALDALWEAFW